MDLKSKLASAAVSLILMCTNVVSAQTVEWKASLDQIPSDYTGPVFEPKFNFPITSPTDSYPWTAINFKNDHNAFLKSLLDYLFEGVSQNSGDPATSLVRSWYHVPLMEHGPAGREFTHGLTRERNSRVGELGTNHRRCIQAWAVGVYNSVGATALHTLFGDGTVAPSMNGVAFPEKSMVGKLLFTEASEQEVPMLAGSPTWTANISKRTPADAVNCPPNDGSTGRTLVPVRLLQLDLAVRVPVGVSQGESPTGWIFGTYVYDGTLTEANPWKRLRPVGLMWGNDPDLTDEDVANGAKPIESLVNSIPGFSRHFGRGGRMNGPVDNPASACLSCHMTAQYPPVSGVPMAPAENKPWTLTGCWFRNLSPTDVFGVPQDGDCNAGQTGQKSLDFSLQAAVALRNYIALTGSVRVVRQSATSKIVVSGVNVEDRPTGNPFVEPFVLDGKLIMPITRSGDLDN